jgi:hypothetical protein
MRNRVRPDLMTDEELTDAWLAGEQFVHGISHAQLFGSRGC